jgi:hypothetical protein
MDSEVLQADGVAERALIAYSARVEQVHAPHFFHGCDRAGFEQRIRFSFGRGHACSFLFRLV